MTWFLWASIGLGAWIGSNVLLVAAIAWARRDRPYAAQPSLRLHLEDMTLNPDAYLTTPTPTA